MPIRHLPIFDGDVGGRLLPQPGHKCGRCLHGLDLCCNLCLVEKHPLKVLVMSKLWKDGLERDQLDKAALAFEACSPYACHAPVGPSDVSVTEPRPGGELERSDIVSGAAVGFHGSVPRELENRAQRGPAGLSWRACYRLCGCR